MDTEILYASMIAVGVTEWLKSILPESAKTSKSLAAISAVISILASVGYGLFTELPVKEIITLSAGTFGVSQTSYNFVLKVLKEKFSNWQSKIESN